MAYSEYFDGRIVAKSNDHFLNNGDLIYSGVHGPVRTDYRGADNYIFAKNLFYYLVGLSSIDLCPIDASSIRLEIDGILYTLDSSALEYDEPFLTFISPSDSFWSTGQHMFSLHIEDSCGNVFDSVYTVTFDMDPPVVTVLNELNAISDSLCILLCDTIAGLNPDTGFLIANGETMYYSISGDSVVICFTPDSGWRFGENEICVLACDSPDECGPNCVDTCFSLYLSQFALHLITPPSDSIIACDDQEIIFRVQYNSDCLPLDSANTYLIIDNTDTFTLDSTQLNFEPSDSLLRFSPGSGYWHSGYHFFEIHIQDNCGNAIDSLFSALFDTEPPTAYMLEPSTNDTFADFSLLVSGNIQRIVLILSDDISGIRPDSITFVVSEDTIPFHRMKYRATHF